MKGTKVENNVPNFAHIFMHNNTTTQKLVYHTLPKQVCLKDFNRYIKTHLKKRFKGPKRKLSFYKIFNYILYVLHTGIQWKQLKTRRNEIHWSNVYKWHHRWSYDGSYQSLFEASIIELRNRNLLAISRLHGDGSNTVVKKGAKKSVTLATSIRKVKKSLL